MGSLPPTHLTLFWFYTTYSRNTYNKSTHEFVRLQLQLFHANVRQLASVANIIKQHEWLFLIWNQPYYRLHVITDIICPISKITLRAHLERLDEGPEQGSDAFSSVQQLYKSHHPEEAEKTDAHHGWTFWLNSNNNSSRRLSDNIICIRI